MKILVVVGLLITVAVSSDALDPMGVPAAASAANSPPGERTRSSVVEITEYMIVVGASIRGATPEPATETVPAFARSGLQ